MKILIIKKIPGNRWEPGVEPEVSEVFGERLIRQGYAVEGMSFYEYNKLLEKQAKKANKIDKQDGSRYRN